jgi:hypothetical protein
MEKHGNTLPLRLEYRTPKELAENPSNWRSHPESQTKALAGVIAETGWAGAVLYNERTKRLIDGHARKQLPTNLLVDGKIPVLIGNWTEEQEKKILVTLDPLVAMAEANKDALEKLLHEIDTESDGVQAMLNELTLQIADEVFAEPSATPESVVENIKEIEQIKMQRREGNSNTASKNDTERYLIIVYSTRETREQAVEKLGLPVDERYVAASSVDIRLKGKSIPLRFSDGIKRKAADKKNSGAGG